MIRLDHEMRDGSINRHHMDLGPFSAADIDNVNCFCEILNDKLNSRIVAYSEWKNDAEELNDNWTPIWAIGNAANKLQIPYYIAILFKFDLDGKITKTPYYNTKDERNNRDKFSKLQYTIIAINSYAKIWLGKKSNKLSEQEYAQKLYELRGWNNYSTNIILNTNVETVSYNRSIIKFVKSKELNEFLERT